MSIRLALIAAALVIPAIGLPAAATPDDVAYGRQVLTEHCAGCYALGHTDTSAHPSAPPFRIIANRYPPESLAESLAEGIVSGHPDMPEIAFPPADVGAIIAYLESLRMH